ncbi:DMT family transporter [Shewanella sp. JM162201]|uniref:DMT family transporter n=1 Tax=Shewanella jiangmenensis TaxID=2837387 RepID=A0ABS5V1C5_9GAMM|nr:DMT family transporter [Shewanella jiangmenensis]MBT1443723.1 DMT family transporter [Shewanella jiangmenensis]
MNSRFYLMAACSAILMGTIGIIARLGELDAATLTFYRLGLGALVLALFLLPGNGWRRLGGWPHWATLVAGVLLGSFILCFLKAIETIPMSMAIMLVYLAPAVAAIGAHLLFNERLTKASLALVLLAFFGFAMLQEFRLQTQGAEAVGLGFAIACLLAYSAFILVNKKIPATVDPYAKTLVQLMVGALCALPFIWSEPLPEGQDWLWLLLAAFFPGFIAILFAVKAIAALPAKVFGTLAYLEPLVVVLAGFFIFSEPMSALKWGGCALILVSGIAQAHLARSQSGS